MKTLAQNVTDTLRDSILHGQFKPGTRIEEVPLAQQMGVSRTPVRAALGTLVSEGLIDHQPKRGYVIRAFAIDDILAAYEVRSVLEGLACRSAAAKGLSSAQAESLHASLTQGDRILSTGSLNPEDHEPYQKINVNIHETLLEASGNSWVSRFAVQAHNIPFASDRIILWVDHAVIFRSHGDHHRIIEAVEMRDCARAEQLMREHVFYAGIILKNNYERMINSSGIHPALTIVPSAAT
jgi:GntR family transcriptional regulator of vanillate catabolism